MRRALARVLPAPSVVARSALAGTRLSLDPIVLPPEKGIQRASGNDSTDPPRDVAARARERRTLCVCVCVWAHMKKDTCV